MYRILFFLFSILSVIRSYAQVTHASLIGAWTYFYITSDVFSDDKVVGTEQQLIFRDGANVTLNIVVNEKEIHQATSYQLKYTILLKDGMSYLQLYSTESSRVLGSYVRMLSDDSLEMAADSGFTTQKYLYRRVGRSFADIKKNQKAKCK